MMEVGGVLSQDCSENRENSPPLVTVVSIVQRLVYGMVFS